MQTFVNVSTTDVSIDSGLGLDTPLVREFCSLAFILALSALLGTQQRNNATTAKISASVAFRDRQLESFALCLVIVLAFHVDTALLAIAFASSFAFIVTQRPVAKDWKAKLSPRSARKPRSTSEPVESSSAGKSSKPKSQPKSAPAAKSNSSAVPNIAAISIPNPADADGQVQEVLKCLKPTAADEMLAKKIQALTRECIATVVPEAQVTAIAQGNLTMLGACGGQPEIEVVVTCEEDALRSRLKQFMSKQRNSQPLFPATLLTKTATKVLSDKLNFVRYWRTQLNSPECKTVHLVPTEFRLFEYSLYIHFSVNTPYPVRMGTLLKEESQRCVELMLMVKRWARERCICNVGRGQLSLYTWCTLALHFWRHQLAVPADGGDSIFVCFVKFIKHYAALFKRDQTPSICFSSDARHASDRMAGPYIEDFLEPGHELSPNASVEGMQRINEELLRASRLLARMDGNAIVELMERWAKPQQEANA